MNSFIINDKPIESIFLSALNGYGKRSLEVQHIINRFEEYALPFHIIVRGIIKHKREWSGVQREAYLRAAIKSWVESDRSIINLHETFMTFEGAIEGDPIQLTEEPLTYRDADWTYLSVNRFKEGDRDLWVCPFVYSGPLYEPLMDLIEANYDIEKELHLSHMDPGHALALEFFYLGVPLYELDSNKFKHLEIVVDEMLSGEKSEEINNGWPLFLRDLRDNSNTIKNLEDKKFPFLLLLKTGESEKKAYWPSYHPGERGDAPDYGAVIDLNQLTKASDISYGLSAHLNTFRLSLQCSIQGCPIMVIIEGSDFWEGRTEFGNFSACVCKNCYDGLLQQLEQKPRYSVSGSYPYTSGV